MRRVVNDGDFALFLHPALKLTVRRVVSDGDLALCYDVTECRPATAGRELLLGVEEDVVADDAAVDPLLLLVQVPTTERAASTQSNTAHLHTFSCCNNIYLALIQ